MPSHKKQDTEVVTHVPTADEIDDITMDSGNDEEIEGFDFEDGARDLESFGDFDPIQSLGQLLVTQDGDTIPDVLRDIKTSLDTLTKVLHKISKSIDKK